MCQLYKDSQDKGMVFLCDESGEGLRENTGFLASGSLGLKGSIQWIQRLWWEQEPWLKGEMEYLQELGH